MHTRMFENELVKELLVKSERIKEQAMIEELIEVLRKRLNILKIENFGDELKNVFASNDF